MKKFLITISIILGIMFLCWMYYLTNQVTKYDTAIEDCYQKVDSLETRTQVLEALIEKQSEQNNIHEVTIYIKEK